MTLRLSLIREIPMPVMLDKLLKSRLDLCESLDGLVELKILATRK